MYDIKTYAHLRQMRRNVDMDSVRLLNHRLFLGLLSDPEFQRVVGFHETGDFRIDDSNGVLSWSGYGKTIHLVLLGSNQYTAKWEITVCGTKSYFLKTWPTASQNPADHHRWLRDMELLKQRIQKVSVPSKDLLCKVPGILSYGVIQLDNTAPYATRWILMEYAPGRSLDQLRGPITGGQAYTITSAVLETLALFQREGLLHRDVAPRNIVVEWDGEKIEQIHLVDPDLVKSLHAEQGGTHLTPRHEHALAYYGATLLEERSRLTADGYALGFTILYLLSNKHPELLRQEATDKRFWRELKKVLKTEHGLGERQAGILVHVLSRLTNPDWTRRIPDYS
ncbi:MAG: phosphotransferase, partial [Thermoplasmatales archaeon]